ARLVESPYADRALVVRGSSKERGSGVERKSLPGKAVGRVGDWDGSEKLAGCRVPQSNSAVVGFRGEERPVLGEGDAGDQRGVALQLFHLPSSNGVPQADRAVPGCRCKRARIR